MPKDVIIQHFKPSYARADRNIAVLVVSDIPFPDGFTPGPAPHLIQIGPNGWGGNHRHRRQELYVGFGKSLVFIWKDDAGVRHEVPMSAKEGELVAVFVPSMVPHLVENRSTGIAVMYELLDVDDGEAEPLTGADSLRRPKAQLV
ncbi:MAG TPA: hypothetical protein VFB59_03355 [Candidatus Saccharimonadales bacterium]|nr:hypothetical protein [Candidatus Saccharimonadales bacterium]